MNIFTTWSQRLCLIAICIFASLQAYDNAHFYRACYFAGEPRFEENVLTTFDFSVAGGQTRKGIDGCEQESCLLNIFGLQNMHQLGQNVSSSNDPFIESGLSGLDLE